MFYQPREGHGLPHNPFNALIVPRPIGWISTRARDGSDNLAPYSFFNGVAYDPPQVMFATTGAKPDRPRAKDTLANAEETGVFCVNMVSAALTDAMNITSAAYERGTDEFAAAGLEKAPCRTIDCARVAASPAALECRLTRIVDLPGETNRVAFGEVTGVHIDDQFIIDGRFDAARFGVLARMGYRDYTIVRETFTLARPDE